jgi:hypothetical protein
MEGNINQIVMSALNAGETEIEGQDIIAWADQRDARINMMKPLEYAYDRGMKVEGKHPIAWAIENNKSMGSDSHPLYLAYHDQVREGYTKNPAKDAIIVVLKDLDISKLDQRAKEGLLEVMLNLYQHDHQKYTRSSLERNTGGLNDLIKKMYNEIVHSLLPEGEKIMTAEADIVTGRGREFEMSAKSLLQKCDIDLAVKLVDKGRVLESRKFEPLGMRDAIESLEAVGKSFNADNDRSYFGVVKSWVAHIGGGGKNTKQETHAERVGKDKSPTASTDTNVEKLEKSADVDTGIKR